MAEQEDAAALENGEAGHAEDEQGPAEEEDLLDDLEDDEYVDEDVDVQVPLPVLGHGLAVAGSALERARPNAARAS
jgi:hypothetical protein